MKLYMSRTSPYARKCRIIARELNLMGVMEEVEVDHSDKKLVRTFNPLGKIPALELKDGSVIFDSPVICEYLDELGHGKFFPRDTLLREAQGRWRAHTLQALGDGLTDALVGRMLERDRRPEDKQVPAMIARYEGAIAATLDALERIAAKFPEYPTIGEIAVGCALGFADLRAADTEWRSGRPQLAAWFEHFSQYESVKTTVPA